MTKATPTPFMKIDSMYYNDGTGKEFHKTFHPELGNGDKF